MQKLINARITTEVFGENINLEGKGKFTNIKIFNENNQGVNNKWKLDSERGHVEYEVRKENKELVIFDLKLYRFASSESRKPYSSSGLEEALRYIADRDELAIKLTQQVADQFQWLRHMHPGIAESSPKKQVTVPPELRTDLNIDAI